MIARIPLPDLPEVKLIAFEAQIRAMYGCDDPMSGLTLRESGE